VALASAAACVGLAACSGSGTSPKGVTQANVAANVLQLAVGTANIYGDLASSGGNLTGTNIVATYRQPAGAFAGDSVLVNSPTLTGPFKLAGPAGAAGADPLSTILTGPAPSEIGGDSMKSTPQAGTAVTTFGTSGGVSGLGLEPFNYNNQGGVPFTVVPYPVPLYDTIKSDANAFLPWGGPPAFDPNGDGEGVRDGNVYPSGTVGISEGLDVFAGVAPSTAGAYTLSAPSTGTSAGTVAPSPATFTLKSTALLPAISPPVPVSNGSGGLSLAVTLPAGVTEAYVQITDFGPDPTATTQPAGCNTASATAPVYYTIFVSASGTATLGSSSGPGTPSSPTPSICTSAQNTTADGATTDGDAFTVQIVGFDYPAYAISYPNSKGNPSPALLGATGQDDITISSAAGYTQPAGGSLTLSSARAIRAQLHLRR
jgi:hypothetical protein